MRKASVLLVVFLVGCSHPTLTIQNEAQVPLKALHVSGRGFDVTIPNLPPGERRMVRIDPDGESGVAVSFEANGRTVRSPAQGYFEDSSLYVVDVSVKPDLAVAVRTELLVK